MTEEQAHELEEAKQEKKFYRFYFAKRYVTRGYVWANSEDEVYELLDELDDTGQINDAQELQDRDIEVYLADANEKIRESEIFIPEDEDD